MIVKCIGPISEISESDWDALGNPNDPFTTHAFLKALEDCGAVKPETGWQPVHMIVELEGRAVAATPLYIKGHSYGEYIFDWSWAEASERAGLSYYPKLLSAVPFTPATGNRFLVGSAADTEVPMLREALWSGMKELAGSIKASSVHVLFGTEDEAVQLSQSPERLHRITHQFHWTRPNVNTFDEWLGLFRSKDRKKIRRERQKAACEVDSISVLTGTELTDIHINTLWSYYRDTCARKWGEAYLKRGFFDSLRTTLAPMTRVFVAQKESQIVATSLCFERGNHLYGRYWGCNDLYDSLHFELCYHQPIEYCLKQGLNRFEAGAQGMHKVKRGLMPTEIHSLHWLAHPGLSQAVADSLLHEKVRVDAEIAILSERGPFRRG